MRLDLACSSKWSPVLPAADLHQIYSVVHADKAAHLKFGYMFTKYYLHSQRNVAR